MIWIAAAVVALLCLVGVPLLVGYLLPVAHTATRRGHIKASPDTLWRLMTDHLGSAAWRPDVKRVELLPDEGGHARWQEIDQRGQGITFKQVEADPPRRLVQRIADSGLPFGGTWTYEITPEGEGSIVTITEQGEIYNPLFRFISKFILGHGATIERYLQALELATHHKTEPAADGTGVGHS
jgi:uncharacterized protein YndB with AHSA1/START domain